MTAILNNKIIFLLILVGSASPCMGASVYKWVDKQGNTHYSEKPPPKSAIVDTKENIEKINLVKTPVIKPEKRGKYLYCGESRIFTLSKDPVRAINLLEEFSIKFDQDIKRNRKDRSRFVRDVANSRKGVSFYYINKKLRNYDTQLAELECKKAWATNELQLRSGDRKIVEDDYNNIRKELAELKKNQDTACGEYNQQDMQDKNRLVKYEACSRSFRLRMNHLERKLKAAERRKMELQ